ncbi:DUF3841 domain-containing protein [Rhizobium laguerreae]|uniref:DUF3841 domain-containing protein n=1 Tax=Rhizobium laguerreae TaxID=1076926 RepID=UPI001C921E82|nr:DUF3841 domain-containing protein [Rhizobium laguerreae]MBY3155341.1 DUF3841 domain-containing protein [Rhizobium laguerreae]
MRLFAYMDSDAYQALLRNGRIIGSPEHSGFQDFAPAYGWLSDVMRGRIGQAPDGCHPGWPVFAWAIRNGLTPLAYDRENEHPKSDEANGASFLVGFDAPDGSCLLSDFDDWHYVLNNWFLPSCGSAAEDLAGEVEAFEALCERRGCDPYRGEGPPEVESARRANWERIVDFPDVNGSAQATLWELKAEWVFLAKARSYSAVKGMAKPLRTQFNCSQVA